jgi:hypothetical protein
MFPSTGRAVIALLERLGHTVELRRGRPAAARCTSTPATSQTSQTAETAETADDVSLPRDRRSGRAGPDVVELFAERAADYRATVVRVPTAGATAAVGHAPARTGARTLVVPPGVPGDLVTLR